MDRLESHRVITLGYLFIHWTRFKHLLCVKHLAGCWRGRECHSHKAVRVYRRKEKWDKIPVRTGQHKEEGSDPGRKEFKGFLEEALYPESFKQTEVLHLYSRKPSKNIYFLGSQSLLVEFSSVTQSCPILCDPMNRSTPGLPVHHQLPESTQTHVHWVGDAIQPSHPLSSPSPPALNLSQHQDLFKWVRSSRQVAKVLELQL